MPCENLPCLDPAWCDEERGCKRETPSAIEGSTPRTDAFLAPHGHLDANKALPRDMLEKWIRFTRDLERELAYAVSKNHEEIAADRAAERAFSSSVEPHAGSADELESIAAEELKDKPAAARIIRNVARMLRSTPPSTGERECDTCKGDPAVCATVPGLRHCEAANREVRPTTAPSIKYPDLGPFLSLVHERQFDIGCKHGNRESIERCRQCYAEVGEELAQRALSSTALPRAECKHEHQRSGYSGTYNLGWCEDCGEITWCSDGAVTPEQSKRDDYGDWCKERVEAWGCKAESEGRQKCKSYCGHPQNCALSLRSAMGDKAK